MNPLRCRILLIGACAAALAGCTSVGPDFRRPTSAWPERWANGASALPAPESRVTSDDLDAQWWDAFHDAELSSLVRRAGAASLDVKVATARLAQSRATRRMAAADAAPSLRASASYQRARSSQDGLLDISGLDGKKNYNLWQPGFDASWELDLWGRLRREVEAADAAVEASADARRGVLLSVLAETALDYLQLRAVQAQQAIVHDDLDVARRSLRLTQIRFADGAATRLETAEAAAQVSAVEAELPRLEGNRLHLVNALSYLLGEPPRALENELHTAAPIPPVPPSVPIGLPSELAERRPDIREAEARLHMATAAIGVAAGDFYPRVTLSANLDLQAMRLGDLGQWRSRMFGVGPAISVPVFEGGRLKGQLRLREAQQQEAMIRFQQATLRAWHDVDDAMCDYATRQQHRDRLAETAGQDRIALDNARRQYAAGATDLLAVLTVQRDWLASQQVLVAASAEVSASLVGLFKALGGGWETTFPADSAPVATAHAVAERGP